MAHARRPFAELVKIAKKSGKSHEAIQLIGELYTIENEIKLLSVAERYAIRQAKSAPILDKIKVWLDNSICGSPPKGKLGKANNLEPYQYLRYMLSKLPLCQTRDDYQTLLPWNLTTDIINTV